MPSSELEDLDALLKAPGWLRFAQHVESEWGGMLHQKLKTAVNDRDDPTALAKLRQIMVAKDAVEQLLRWPSDRLATLTRAVDSREQEQAQPLSRRGPL